MIRKRDKIKQREYARRYRERHPDRIKNSRKNWNKKWELKRKERLLVINGGKCQECGSMENLTIEHKIPQCIGGKNTEENLTILCLKCNMKKYHELVKKALIFYFQHHSA